MRGIRSLFIALTAFILFAGITAASAAERVPYTPQAFASAQKAGKPILVEISAPWCPTCKAQKPILSKLMSEPQFKDLAVFEVDFDNQKDVVKGFKATTQSTLITFKGANETGRSVGDTKAPSIEALLNKAI